MAIIKIDHVTKQFRLGQMQSVKAALLNGARRLLGRPVEKRALLDALSDVTFSVNAGDVVGIIGHNGAGKSTLLKLISGITQPTRGSINVGGSIAPLIEVGAGFIPDFTARENIYLNGAILGMSKKVLDRKFDEIVAFAEIEQFLDTPIKRFSTGMQVRLGFALATSVDADILIVDEVLAVGDLAFQRKCFDRIEALINNEDRTVLVVSHNLRQIERLCKRVLLLDHGTVVADGTPRAVCNRLFETMDAQIAARVSKEIGTRGARAVTDGSVELISIHMLDTGGQPTNMLKMGSGATLKVRYRVHRRLIGPIFGVGIHTTDFIYLSTEQSYGRLQIEDIDPGVHELKFAMKTVPLLPGIYSFRLGIASGNSGGPLFYMDNALHFQVTAAGVSRAWNTTADEGFFALDADWEITTPSTELIEH